MFFFFFDEEPDADTKTTELPHNLSEKEVILYQTGDGNVNVSVY